MIWNAICSLLLNFSNHKTWTRILWKAWILIQWIWIRNTASKLSDAGGSRHCSGKMSDRDLSNKHRDTEPYIHRHVYYSFFENRYQNKNVVFAENWPRVLYWSTLRRQLSGWWRAWRRRRTCCSRRRSGRWRTTRRAMPSPAGSSSTPTPSSRSPLFRAARDSAMRSICRVSSFCTQQSNFLTGTPPGNFFV